MLDKLKLEHDNSEEFRDPQTFDLEDAGYYDDCPLIEQWARLLGGPLLDLACGTGRMALRMAALGYQVTGVDVVPEMIEQARQKGASQSASIEWFIADARAFHLDKQFSFIYMLEHPFQFLLTREDQEAMLARVREHLRPEGCFLFDTRNPNPQNISGHRHPEGKKLALPDGGQLAITEERYYDPMTQLQHYTRHLTFLHADGKREEKVLRTTLRYVYPQELEALLYYNGFEVRASYGNWQQNSLVAASPEMIYVIQRRK
jgi:2-polyprenyl-3-methyl-5-hydroxy-6-metoxy-1,4-benzoquinol methylase